MRPRVLLLVAAATTIAASMTGSAASLGTVSSTLVGAGSASVPRCDPDGFTISYTTSGGAVTSVTIGAVADPGCEGGRLSVTLVDSAGASIASGGPVTVPTDGDTSSNAVSVSVSPNPAADKVAAYHAVVAGP
jgi:hypothetical protein